MLKSLSLMLAFILFTGTVSPFANASMLGAGIDEAVQRFNYAVNVEWDQQDPAFIEKAQSELEKAIQGIDKDELFAYTVSSISDATTRQEFVRLVNALKAQKVSESKAAAIAQEWAEQASVQGLNFLGKGGGFRCRFFCKAVIVVIAVVVIKTLVSDHDEEDVPAKKPCKKHKCSHYPHYSEYPYYDM